MSLFEVENLSKTFFGPPDTQVLFDVSFAIKKGEFVAVRGASGSGKSTLLHILGFLLNLSEGKYSFNGKRYEDHTDEEVALIRNGEMGFIFQAFNLLGRRTVYENVCLPLLYSGRPESEWKDRIERSVERVGLTHRINFETLKLSGGERQRVAIARALVNEPSVIFADEPTGNLDSVSGKEVMETLKDLHSRLGHTIVLVTHDGNVAGYAERELLIEDGRLKNDHKTGSVTGSSA